MLFLYNGYKSIGDAEKVDVVVLNVRFYEIVISSRLNKSFRCGSKTLSRDGEAGDGGSSSSSSKWQIYVTVAMNSIENSYRAETF